MRFNNLHFRLILSCAVVAAMLITPLGARAQLVPLSSITGGSSVFVFRSVAKAVKRFVAAVKPTRTPAQRKETVAKIKRQYDTIARTMPKVNRAKAVDPDKLPKNVRTLPAAEGSKLFAGVGEYYNDKGDYEKAIEFFRDAVTLDEANSEAKSGLSEAFAIKGNDLLVKDQASAAKGVFLEALKLDPKNAAAYFGLGEVYAELDQTADAIAAYEKSIENNKDLTEIYVPLGILYYQAGEIAKADTLLSKAILFSADSAETQFFLGLVRSSQNRNEEALAAFQKAKSIDVTLAEAFYYAGEMLVRLKRTADAIPEFKKATEIKPTYFDAWFSLGEAYFEMGNHAEAIIAYKAAAKLKNNDWEVFAGLGEAYRQSKDFENAEANLNLAAIFLTNSKDPNKETLADLYSKVGLSIGQQCDINMQKNILCKWPAAIRALKKAAELTENPIDYVNLGWAYFRDGHADAERKDMDAARPKLELAQAALQKAVAAGGPAVEFGLQNLASVQIDLADYKGAIDTLTKLTAAKPEMNFAKYALGVAYNRSGDLVNAEKWLKIASDADPNNLGYLVGLADTLITRKNGKELQKVIDRIRPLDPAMAANLDQRKKLLRL
jgi:tetratricopeptide (TPR) repeat protein